MTPKEAQLFLKTETPDDIHDRWEEELFGIKKFLLTSTPIPKVFLSKLARLEKFQEAYVILSGITVEQPVLELESNPLLFSEDVEEAFHEFHRMRTQFKATLHGAECVFTIRKIVEKWLDSECAYIKKWKFTESILLPEEVIQSKEPDPMTLLHAIKNWKAGAAFATFQQLQNDFSFLPDALRIEVKRLTLLSNYYGERRI
jgi:hypothetical protein